MMIRKIYFQVKAMLRAFLNEDYDVAGFRLPETRVKTFHYVRKAEMWALEEAINMVSNRAGRKKYSSFRTALSPIIARDHVKREVREKCFTFLVSVG